MKSERGKPLSLTVHHDRGITPPVENFVLVSSSFQTKSEQMIVRFRKSYLGKNHRTNNDTVEYPVHFDRNIPKDKIILSAELRRELGAELGRVCQCTLDSVNMNEIKQASTVTFVLEKMHGGIIREKEVDTHTLKQAIRDHIKLQPSGFSLQVGQIYIISFMNIRVQLRVDHMSIVISNINEQEVMRGGLTDLSEIKLVNDLSHYFHLTGEDDVEEDSSHQLEEIPLDFTSLGIGGLKKEIGQIIHSHFYSRIIKPELLRAYGIEKHAKGILLYGSPGTGKTLLAVAISKLFAKENVRIIQGPQLKNSYYGQTQQNLANLFSEAYEHPQRLYVYIFDEIDALFPRRGGDSSVSTSNNNDLVSRFLPILDGPNSPKNIIVIGTTNRKELIDEALLRPGRFETVIHIGLPSESDRLEILKAQTHNMSQTLHADVDLLEIAKLSVNFTGAELAQLVNKARNFAIGKNIIGSNQKLHVRPDLVTIDQAEKVSQSYFLKALQLISPAYGKDEGVIQRLSEQYIEYHSELADITRRFNQCLSTLINNKHRTQVNFLIDGASGTGKTCLAAHLALLSKFPFLQIISSELLISQPLARQLDIIDETFASARESTEPSVIILDDLENILEASAEGGQYNNRLRLKMAEMLKGMSASKNKLMVIATTSDHALIKRINLANSFHAKHDLHTISLQINNTSAWRDILVPLCKHRQIEWLQGETTSDQSRITLTIRDLIYHMDAYCCVDKQHQSFNQHDFLVKLCREYSHTLPSETSVDQPSVRVSSMRLF